MKAEEIEVGMEVRITGSKSWEEYGKIATVVSVKREGLFTMVEVMFINNDQVKTREYDSTFLSHINEVIEEKKDILYIIKIPPMRTVYLIGPPLRNSLLDERRLFTDYESDGSKTFIDYLMQEKGLREAVEYVDFDYDIDI